MENAVEALKIGFGVIVFAVALTVLFRMTSLIRGTSEEIFTSIDETTYIDYTVDTSKINQTGNENSMGKRIVSITDIIPTIYRYSQEGYGVTILHGSQIVARFDLSTESQVASCNWEVSKFDKTSNSVKINNNKVKYSLTKYIKKNIYDVAEIAIPEDLDKQSGESYETGSVFDNFSWLNNLVTRIYYTGKSSDPVYTLWISSNRYSNNYITQRINCDLYGEINNGVRDGITHFVEQYPGVNNSALKQLGQHKAYYSNGLLDKYKNSQFIEYITEVDNQNAYIIDEDGNLTDLLQFGTVRYAKQREIIYVYNGER